MSVDDMNAGPDPGDTGSTDTGGTDTGGDTGGDTGSDTSSDTSSTDTSSTNQDQAQAQVRAQPQVDDSLASVGEIPADPGAEVAQYDTNFDGSEVA